MKYCFDTNIIVDLLRKRPIENEKISKLRSGLRITAITVAELYKGASISAFPEKAEILIDELLQSSEVLELDIEACKEFGRQYAKLRKAGKLVEPMDILIGAISHSHDCILATKDSHDFENMGIKIEKW